MRNGEAVVLIEVAEMGVALIERLAKPMGGLLGDVLGEPARRGAGDEDALDGLVLEGAEGAGVGERGAEVGGGVALAQEQDLPGVVAGGAALGGGEAGEEARALLADVAEGLLELVEVGTAAIPRRMDRRRGPRPAARARAAPRAGGRGRRRRTRPG